VDLGQGEHARVIVGVVGDVKSFVGESAAAAVFVPAAQASSKSHGYSIHGSQPICWFARLANRRL